LHLEGDVYTLLTSRAQIVCMYVLFIIHTEIHLCELYSVKAREVDYIFLLPIELFYNTRRVVFAYFNKNSKQLFDIHYKVNLKPKKSKQRNHICSYHFLLISN